MTMMLKERMKNSIIKLLIPLSVLIIIITTVRITGLNKHLDQTTLRTWIEGFGSWGPVFYISFYSVAPALFLPGLPITIAGGLAFGPIWGVIYTLIGSTIGASFAFLIARYFVRGQVEKLLKGKLKGIDEGVEKKGWIYVAITRLIPLFPFNLLNYAFGLTKIRFSHYLIATSIFMLPGIIAYVIFGSSILDILRGNLSLEFIIGIILIAILSIMPTIYNKKKKQRQNLYVI